MLWPPFVFVVIFYVYFHIFFLLICYFEGDARDRRYMVVCVRGHMQYAAQAVVRMTSPPRCKEVRGCPAYPANPPTFKGPLTRTI